MGGARHPRPICPARRLAARAGIALAALLIAATGVAAQERPQAGMPKSVKRFTDSRADCFLPDERQNYDEWMDQFREPLPGCQAGVIPPQETIQSFRVYKQGSNRVIDCSTLRKNEFNTRFLDTYLDDVVTRADNASKSPGAATCAANMLHAWAKAGAMTRIGDQGNENQSQNQITWTLGGLSAAYYASPAVRDAAREIPAEGGTADDEIVAWFHKLTGPVVSMMERERKAKNEDNLQYWRAFAILPTAFLAEDPRLMKQSRRVFDVALGEVVMGAKDPANDGWLPFEMERGQRALHYQSYASMPVLAMGLLSKSEGCGFLGDDADRRERLTMMVTRVLEGRDKPGIAAAQVARYSRKGKAIEQIKTATVRDAAQFMYLVNQIDPSVYKAVDANLADFTGKPRPAIKPTAGSKAGNDRLGGAYAGLAAAADRPGPPPDALAPVCRGGGE